MALTTKQLREAMKELARRAGVASARKMSPAQRKARAKRAAEVRWAKAKRERKRQQSR